MREAETEREEQPEERAQPRRYRRRPPPDQAPARRKMRRAVLIVGGSLLAVGLVLGTIFSPWIISALRHQTLKGSVEKFLYVPPASDTSEGPYITGKVVLIDRKTRTIDEVQKRLPDEIRAYSEGEVGTVIWLEWDFKANEGPWGGATSHYSVCKVTVIDRQRNLIVGESEVMGASSAVATGAGRGPFRAPAGTMTARRANSAVLNYVKGLPRR
jgi:hypothetical protein